MKMLPATAQVAAQEGKYLAKQFNAMAKNEPIVPFKYHHLGSFAYIGGDDAGAKRFVKTNSLLFVILS